MKAIHLIAPSGASLDSKSPLAGIDWLGQQGNVVQNTDCVRRVYERFAGSDEERLTEFNSIANLDPQTIVMAMRGGYGLHRLLPGIEWDAIAKATQKGLQICGHSDFTVFQLGLLAKTGAITLAGPMLNYDFGRLGDDGAPVVPDEFMWQHFQTAVQDRKLDCQVSIPQSFLGAQSSRSLTGFLWGGNLTVLAGLVGTPYLPSANQTQGGILFLEDVNEHPYRIERMLMQLLDAGVLSNQGAIVLGGFSAYRLYDNDKGYSLERAIEAVRNRLAEDIPILTGLPFGHQANKLTLPIGAIARLDFNTSGFELKAKW
ncbi:MULTISPECIES: LD-carboxypeptidase [unclassified Polynucleobacter]|uniref:LD-carboxypeptidase n=1 Tax=unclassified Polynucleobacter TaxID=2640945 RepID=UPI001C0AF4FE|nr:MULTISPECIES: LD-carboxypeptidase [unclassified Polynucleobacter]MBU3603762.1 LD-carboxypeptidase [Polynucleobacter sp. AP-Kaivos-20-H2]MBU3619400.1 LD-carboxypeptidase [Polynucleobacter sp. JS-Fieb-80-E5]